MSTRVFALDNRRPTTQLAMEYYRNVDELEQELQREHESIIFLFWSSTYDVYGLCASWSARFPSHYYILVVPNEQLKARELLHSHANDVVEGPVETQQLERLIRSASRTLREKTATPTPPEPSRQGKVLTVTSAKGGLGKSTLCVNLAVACAKLSYRVAVLDLDLQFGDVSIMFNVQPKLTLYEWALDAGDTSQQVDRYISRTNYNVDLLAKPNQPEFGDAIHLDHVDSAIAALKAAYDIVIIDTPPALSDSVLAAIDQSERILVLTMLELPTLQNTKLCLETLQTLKMKGDVSLILSRDQKVHDLSVEDAEKTLKVDVLTKIPENYPKVVESVNIGVPLASLHPRCDVSKAISNLANTLFEHPQQTSDQHVKRSRFLSFRKN